MNASPRPEKWTFEQRVLHILAEAHKRMDALGYPPCTRPIDDRERAA